MPRDVVIHLSYPHWDGKQKFIELVYPNLSDPFQKSIKKRFPCKDMGEALQYINQLTGTLWDLQNSSYNSQDCLYHWILVRKFLPIG